MITKSLLAFVIYSFLNVTMAQTLCSKEELQIFNCTVGVKIISICGSTTSDHDRDWLEYRSGTKNGIDLIYPEERSHPKNYFRFQRLYSSVESSVLEEVQFKRNSVSYTIYKHEIKGKIKSGLYIEDGAKINHLACKRSNGLANFSSTIGALGLDPIE